MLIAREISVGGCLFLLFSLGLFIVFNVPLQNILRRILPRNDKMATLIEVCLIFIVARVLAHWAEPGVTIFLEELTEFIAGALVTFFKH